MPPGMSCLNAVPFCRTARVCLIRWPRAQHLEEQSEWGRCPFQDQQISPPLTEYATAKPRIDVVFVVFAVNPGHASSRIVGQIRSNSSRAFDEPGRIASVA